jgi:hypothetical protein
MINSCNLGYVFRNLFVEPTESKVGKKIRGQIRRRDSRIALGRRIQRYW